MKVLTLTIFFVFLSLSFGQQSPGIICTTCDVVVHTVQVDAVQEEKPIEQVVEEFCNKYFNGTWVQVICDDVMFKYGDDIINYLSQGFTPDQVCQAMELCKNKTCNLYPSDGSYIKQIIQNTKENAIYLQGMKRLIPMLFRSSERLKQKNNININPFDYFKEIVDKVFNKHEPLIDEDNDRFSTLPTFRGSNWRGKDCDDSDGNIYPGRKYSLTSNPSVDYNCNGISGVNSQGQSWEQLLCGQSQPRGVVVLGDSASAHFSVPFPNPYLNHTSPEDYAYLFEDELDWPACSWSTGHWESKDCPYSPLSTGMDSVYMRLWKRNHCNFRDFQTIAVNGARSSAMSSTIVESMSRNQTEDQPLLVFYALVGNDVCNPHPGFEHMSTPEDFYSHITTTLKYLDTILPNGSVVFFIGLEAGELIWPTMHDVLHPLGVTYERLWDFTSCLGINPCWGWLQSDPSTRNYTTYRAQQLNQQFPLIIQNQQYNNFQMHYLGNFMKENFDSWVGSGGNPVDFFEVVGGGHPSQLAQELDAAAIWDAIEKNFPEALGPVNPNNALIETNFGDQGGY